MRKNLLGIGLVLLAVYLLLKDTFILPDLGIPVWTLIIVVGAIYWAVQNFLRKDYGGSYVCGVIALIVLERHFNWLHVSTGTLIMAAVLAGVGLGMIFKPALGHRHYGFDIYQDGDDFFDKDMSEDQGKDTVFGNSTRYINDDNLSRVSGDLVFSGTSIYFANATILGQQAVYTADAVFSTVKLYVPRNWDVQFTGDKVFSMTYIPQSGMSTDKTLVITGDYVFSRLEVFYI